MRKLLKQKKGRPFDWDSPSSCLCYEGSVCQAALARRLSKPTSATTATRAINGSNQV